MSQPPNRLNPGAFSFVPGQVRNQPPQAPQPPQGDPNAPQGYPGGPNQYPPQFQQQGYYPPYQGGYQQPAYGQYGPPPGQGGYGRPPPPNAGYGGYQPPQTYTPPQVRQHQQQSYQPSESLPPRSQFIPGPPQPDRAPIVDREQLPAPPAVPASTGPATTIRLNIGGGSGSATPPKPSTPAPKKDDNAGPAKTISLNIGGSSSPAPPSVPPAAAVPASEASAAPSSATPPPNKPAAPSTTVSKKDFNFSADKSKTNADAVLIDTLAAADEETLKDLYGDGGASVDPNMKSHVNIVFVGHVDAGKSTLGGQLLHLTGMIDKRTLEKYERDAKEAGRESWYLSWALDSTTQERAKGKTVEVGRAYFETEARRYTILDAPGHKTYVPFMISGAAQADVAVLVISARKGEFETGFEKGGQTREHVMLVKTAGVAKLIVVINKMDDPTVEWQKERFDEIKDKLTPFVKAAGFNPKTDVSWVPISAYTSVNVKEKADKKKYPWIEGSSLLEVLDQTPIVDRKINGPVMMPISEKYKDLGTVVVGKLESGRIRKGDSLLMMPNKVTVEVLGIFSESEEEIPNAWGGDNVRVRLRGVDDEDVSPGFVLTSIAAPIHAVRRFEAQLAILDSKNIICAGYTAVMHVHTLAEEVSLSALLHYFDKKTGRKSKKPPQFAKKGQKIIAQIETTAPICLERFVDHQQLGRFTLRDEGKTIAIGKVTKLLADVEEVAAITEGVANATINPPPETVAA